MSRIFIAEGLDDLRQLSHFYLYFNTLITLTHLVFRRTLLHYVRFMSSQIRLSSVRLTSSVTSVRPPQGVNFSPTFLHRLLA